MSYVSVPLKMPDEGAWIAWTRVDADGNVECRGYEFEDAFGECAIQAVFRAVYTDGDEEIEQFIRGCIAAYERELGRVTPEQREETR